MQGMNRRQAIDFLRNKLNDIPNLSKLRWDNVEYPVWRDEIQDVLEEVFGGESKEYQKFYQARKTWGYDPPRNDYNRLLQKLAAVIRSIMDRYERLEIETEPATKSSIAKADWKDIENEFGITKNGFGRRINFIKDPFKRTIIFRDVEQAFALASSGFSKPAVILAGSVIEELLRLYLEYKNISPLSENFDGYIRTCEQNGLLKDSVSRLSHAVRQFRNLVHLSAEKTKKHTISKATAIGAVSSIFTIANDF